MIVYKCIKHELKIYLQNVHIAQLWQRLSASWQKGAVSPAMFTLSFFLKKIRFCLVISSVCFTYWNPICQQGKRLSAPQVCTAACWW